MTERVNSDETLDEMRSAGLGLIQARKGYRFSLDPLLVVTFADFKKGDRVADLGTGSGVIPLLVARRCASTRVVGIEVQADLADRARRSVALNQMTGQITIVAGDLRQSQPELPSQSFDVVLANPPYRRPGSGRVAPGVERAAARHELAGGLEDFLAAAARLLRDGGRFYLVFLAERLAELFVSMRQHQLEPKRLRSVHGRSGDPARMVLVEGRKRGGAGLVIEAPLFIYDGEEYSAEVQAIYAGKS
ncbi:tRNA1(Val) (adenine(37)-N6)-methyltransferase [Desulfuromonas sp. DDH964]|uniref:tRNA1(Val) (adenine(37)-N6)-methyltransferase n=1 Tax=Desulfuromonas sp. DDH964 TaxID=1823759 RepID=UPI00078B98BC|nr:SAM-dependent methyltransferase [Desulfuromonas sp. DDH964]